MVAKARHDDAPGRERVDQLCDGLDGQIGLVGDTDQRGARRLRQGPQPNGDRAADSLFGMGVLYDRQRQPRERIPKRRVMRHDRHDRLKTGVEEAARGFSDEQLTPIRLKQLLETKSSR